MSGHSAFKNIMHRKGAQDRLRARVFAKLAREITVAAKSGQPDPEYNARLRSAIQAARSENMPKDNIERAIKKASGTDGAVYDEMRYEGFGPGNVAVIVDALTDNHNRTAASVRSIFNKNGGSMGETGSVAFNFERIGLIQFPADVASADDMFEAALDAGANDVESDEEDHEITCSPDDLAAVRDKLEARFGTPTVARFDWKPTVTMPLTDAETAKKFFDFLEVLNDDDDVQHVTANYEISDELLASLKD